MCATRLKCFVFVLIFSVSIPSKKTYGIETAVAPKAHTVATYLGQWGPERTDSGGRHCSINVSPPPPLFYAIVVYFVYLSSHLVTAPF